MKVLAITAGVENIVFTLEAPDGAGLLVHETIATIGKKPGRLLSETEIYVQAGIASVPRFDGAHDRIYSAFRLYHEGKRIEGMLYVTEIAPEVQVNREFYPQPDSIKTLNGTPEDIRALGIRQSPYNISLPSIMTMAPGDDAIAYEHDGAVFYFIRSRVEAIDAQLRALDERGVLVTLILLNSPRLFGSTGEQALLDTVIHPAFDWTCKDAFISAFDMQTEDGQRYYRAFVEFLAERYTRADRLYGRVGGAIISNEVDSQYVWGNAGEMPVTQYAQEYTQAMRLAWICGQKHAGYFRVYASLDQHWCGSAHDIRHPLRYYEGRTVLEEIAACSARDGDFGWHVAYHPYPEDLRWPDFWNDRAVDFTYSTRKITFKNMEVLAAYLAQERFRYRNKPRRIIFSEQGFNSQDGPLMELTEQMGEAGYVLAYMKARNMPTVDMFMHHAYVDNPHEFGLNLGIRRYDPNAPMHAGEKKPIYDAVKDMDTDAENDRVEKARGFIGEALFDYLLDPPLVHGDRDLSKDNEFGADGEE